MWIAHALWFLGNKRKARAKTFNISRECSPGGGYSQKNWVGVCGLLPKTLSLFMTKICDFPYPIYDLTKNLIPYLWPDPYINTLFQTCLIIISLVQTSVKGNVHLLLLGRLQDCMCKEVASSKKTNSRLECKNRNPIYDHNGGKMTVIDTLFMTKTAEKPYPLGPHIPI